MKLLIILPSIERGGAEEYALTIAAGAVNKGWEVCAAFPEEAETRSLREDFLKRGVRYYPLDIVERDVDLLDFKKIRQNTSTVAKEVIRLLKQLKPENALFVCPFPILGLGVMVGCALRGIPLTTVFQLVHKEIHFKRRHLILYYIAWMRKQQLVAVSYNNRHLLSDSFKVSKNRINVISNGINFDSFKMNKDNKARARQRICEEIGVNISDKLLLTVARLNSQKGYEVLISIISKIRKEFPDTRWLWVGGGCLEEELKSLVKKDGLGDCVYFLGERVDVVELLNAADSFVFPTRFEGQPHALLEAMAAGLPIVTTNASGIPEVIEHMKHGVVCEKENSEALYEGVRFALQHPDKMKVMAQNALERVKDFSESEMIEKTLTILGRYVKRRKR